MLLFGDVKKFKSYLRRELRYLVLCLVPVLGARAVFCQDACHNARAATITADWNSGTIFPSTIRHSGSYCLVLQNVNDALYTYNVSIAPAEAGQTAFEALQSAITGLSSLLRGSNARELPANLVNPCTNASSDLDDIKTQLQSMQLQKTSAGKYPSRSINQTMMDWNTGPKVKIQQDLAEISTLGCTQNGVPTAVKSLQDSFNNFDAIVNAKSHVEQISLDLDATDHLIITVNELYGGQPTEAAAKQFELKAAYPMFTASAGFLLTTLQARSYSSRTAPGPGGTGTQNVLGVDYGTGIRPALAALLNVNIPGVNWHNTGFALSTGPVFDISNGKADTSKLGVFAGLSWHLWDQLYITPGFHFGEFADFPLGFQNGQTIPPNTGTPTAVKRYTARFAFAITYKLGSASKKPSNSATDTKPSAAGN